MAGMNELESIAAYGAARDRVDDAELATLIEDFLKVTGRTNGIRLIRSRAPESLFKPSELKILEEEVARAADRPRRFEQPDATIVIKATRLCNLRCSYCNSWGEGPGNVISFRALVRRTLEGISGAATRCVDFVWHGGEMTLLRPALVEKMLWVQERFRPEGLHAINSIQTNGVNISDEWLDFLASVPIGVGVSIDGPRHIHDRSRRAADGSGSYDRVIANLRRLRARNIPFGALIVVGRATLDMAIEDYLDWLWENGIHAIDFLNVAPCDDDLQAGVPDDEFVPIDEFVRWLTQVYDRIQSDARWRDIRVRFIEDLTSAVREGRSPVGCYFSGKCFSNVVTVNPSGSVSPCDKYVTTPHDDIHKPFGTPLATAIEELSGLQPVLGSQQWVEAGTCRWRHLCRGGCPYDSQTLSIRNGGAKLACCGFGPLFDRIEENLARAEAADAPCS